MVSCDVSLCSFVNGAGADRIHFSTAQSTARSGMSKSLDESFDSAYNTSIIEGDLPDVRWGRIDYLNVTYLTTKWNVWQ